MLSTPPSLLERLRRPEERQAWEQFVRLYTPLLCAWARRLGLPNDDIADLVQEVFLRLHQQLPKFVYDPNQSFRGWLRTMLVNRLRSMRERKSLPVTNRDLEQLEGPAGNDLFEETEYRNMVVARAVKLLRAQFNEQTWQAFWHYVVLGETAEATARQLEISVNVIYLSKSRVLARLRQELAGLLD